MKGEYSTTCCVLGSFFSAIPPSLPPDPRALAWLEVPGGLTAAEGIAGEVHSLNRKMTNLNIFWDFSFFMCVNECPDLLLEPVHLRLAAAVLCEAGGAVGVRVHHAAILGLKEVFFTNK